MAGVHGRAEGPPPDHPSSPTNEVVATAMRGLFGRDSIYMVLWVAQLVGAAAVTPVATRVLRIDQYGNVASATAVMQVLFVVAGCGLQVVIQRKFAESGGIRAARGLLTVSLLVAVGVTAVAVAAGPLWSARIGFSSFDGPVRLAVLWAGASAVTASCLGLLRSQDRLRAFSTVSLLQSVVAEVTSLLLVAVVSPTAEMFIAGQLLVQVLAAGLGLLLTRPRMLGRSDLPLMRSGLAFALPLVPATLSALVLVAADRLMINAHLGEDATARYQVAYNVGSLPILVIGALDSTWLPRIFSVHDGAQRDAVLDASRDALYRLLAPVLVGFSLGAPLVLRLWAPPEFQTDKLLLVTTLVVLSAVPYAAALSVRRGLLARGATAGVALAAMLAAALNVGLNLVLIPARGLSGAAVAALAAFTLQYLVLRVWAYRAGRRARRLGSLLQVTVGSGLALAGLLLPVSPTGLVVRVLLGCVCLLWLAVALHRITPFRRRAGNLTAPPRTFREGESLPHAVPAVPPQPEDLSR